MNCFSSVHGVIQLQGGCWRYGILILNLREEKDESIFLCQKENETKRKPNGNFHCEYFLLASLTTGCLFCSRSFRYNIKKKFSKNDNYLKYFFNIFLMITVSLNFCPVNLLYRVFRMEQIYNMLIIKI